jgi:hypothetical protein
MLLVGVWQIILLKVSLAYRLVELRYQHEQMPRFGNIVCGMQIGMGCTENEKFGQLQRNVGALLLGCALHFVA